MMDGCISPHLRLCSATAAVLPLLLSSEGADCDDTDDRQPDDRL
jgi:hypothetical protein